jgi:CHASE3 domain sensor protein
MAVLEKTARAKLAYVNQAMAVRTNHGADAVARLIAAGRGQELMNQIRSLVRQIEGTGEKLLDDNMKNSIW